MPDFEEEEPQDAQDAAEAQPDEEEVKGKRRAFVPIWFLGLGALLAVVGIGGYFAAEKAPEYIQTIQSRSCLACHAEIGDALKRKNIHLPFAQGRCTSCHTAHGLELVEGITLIERLAGNVRVQEIKEPQVRHGERLRRSEAPKPSERSKLTGTMKNLCADECHSGLVELGTAKKYTMPPFAKKQCSSCHQAHASDQDNLLKAAIKPLCLSCHPEVSNYFSSDVEHPPFMAGACTSCHRGHSSNVKKLLRRGPKTLCLGCHPSVARLMKLDHKMEPFELGQCPSCHNPHGSSNAKLLKKPLPELCFSCHKKIADLRDKPVQMPPFRQGLCLGCHLPHASENAKLLQAGLRKNAVCYLCHEDIKEHYEPIGHNTVISNASPYQPEGGVGSCLNCHEPHGSDFTGLIQKEVISLCLGCHGPRRYFAHPIGINWEDPWRGSYLRCTSCHNPMGSGLPKLKRRDLDGLCLSCHKASDPSYIYSESRPWHSYRIPDSM